MVTACTNAPKTEWLLTGGQLETVTYIFPLRYKENEKKERRREGGGEEEREEDSKKVNEVYKKKRVPACV